MGACASVPKAMRGKDATAPAPEQPKEEISTAGEVAEVEKKAEVEGGDKTTPSLEKLLDEGEAPKEAPKEEETTSKSSVEVVAVSEPSATVEEKSAAAPPPQAEAAAKEEKKTETAEQK